MAGAQRQSTGINNSWNSDSEPAQRSGTRGHGSPGARGSLTCGQGDRVVDPRVNLTVRMVGDFHPIRLPGRQKGLC